MSRCIPILFLFLLACNDTQVVDPGPDAGQDLSADLPAGACGKGTKTVVQDGRSFCVYTWEIVIETGFNCPVNFDFFQGFEPVFGVCTDFGPLNELEIITVFDDFQERPKFNPIVETQPKGLDLLFVVDNSGSMCQEQDRLVAAFEGFITPLKDVDFHLGITTTHMETDYAPEPVAQPGFLQSSPQPVPGFDLTCIQDVDESGMVIEKSYNALKKRIAFAASCMETPDPFFLSLNDADISCATGDAECSIGTRCGGANPKCKSSDITPPSDSYRSLPKTFRASDYQKEGALDIENLVADFRCALTVGTRGHGIEKGLSAAVLAVSKDLTGGTIGAADADANQPNHGFIRKDTRFGLVFVTDENDCSHDGSINETSSCGDAVCEYAIETGNGLLSISKVKADLISNLEATKGRKLTTNDVVVGSIHGRPTLFSGSVQNECPMGTPTGVVPACATTSGVAFSGSRYSDFLAAFGNSGYALSNASPICLEDWTEYFISMGAFFRSQSN